MPANFSAVAENEMTYVVGGGLVDVLAPAMNDGNWQNINTNLINIIGNTYLSATVPAALGMVFSGTYVPGKVLEGAFKGVKGLWNDNNPNGDIKGGLKALFNIGLQGVGVLASIYTLGTAGKVGLEVKKFA